jgi:hypothetical protein
MFLELYVQFFRIYFKAIEQEVAVRDLLCMPLTLQV